MPSMSPTDFLWGIPISLNSFLSAAVCLFIAYLGKRWAQAATHKLGHIPTVGSPGVFSSYRDAFRFFKHGHEMIAEGYMKYPGTAFKVATMSRWLVVVSGPQMLDDIRRAIDDQLSFREAAAEILQIDYMIGRQIRADPYHVKVVRTPLTRNLGVRFSDIKDEIVAAFSELIPAKQNEWTSVVTYTTVMKIICRTSNRLFVGLPLCRNPEYRSINEQFTIDVLKGGALINMFPPILKPLVGQCLTKVPTNIKCVISHVGPLIQAHLHHAQNRENAESDNPNNLISWLLEEAQGHQRSPRDLVVRLLSVNFAAIHTTTMAFTNVLYDLASHPEYAEPMRKEVISVIESDGWTKASMGRMRKVDSFIKESQRLAIGSRHTNRKAVKEFTFSNGITVPAGTHIVVATHATHSDEKNYDDSHEFRGFRFADMREEDGEGIKHQMVSLAPEYLIFGTGRHACPGRFFAVNELKAMLAYTLLNYDVKMSNDSPRPDHIWFQGQCSPSRTAEVMFRRRV